MIVVKLSGPYYVVVVGCTVANSAIQEIAKDLLTDCPMVNAKGRC